MRIIEERDALALTESRFMQSHPHENIDNDQILGGGEIESDHINDQ